MADPRPRIRLSSNEVSAGDVIDVRTLISHTMESGQRRDGEGNIIPRQIINTFRAEFGGEVVFEAQLEPAISANPYMQFALKPQESGKLTLTWIDDDGHEITAEEEITVV
jgi:sulfur-oxidizing protein SoxZ